MALKVQTWGSHKNSHRDNDSQFFGKTPLFLLKITMLVVRGISRNNILAQSPGYVVYLTYYKPWDLIPGKVLVNEAKTNLVCDAN